MCEYLLDTELPFTNEAHDGLGSLTNGLNHVAILLSLHLVWNVEKEFICIFILYLIFG